MTPRTVSRLVVAGVVPTLLVLAMFALGVALEGWL